jgi:pimeloyl-ACP methyl ester carboxylesterase
MSTTVTRMGRPSAAVWCAAMAVLAAGCQSSSPTPRPSGGTSTSAHVDADDEFGQMVDVGGHRLYLWCRGVGSPTVVFENGQDSSWRNWQWGDIPNQVGSRACVYNRVNIAPSDTVTTRHTGADSVRDLHNLLQLAAVPGPYLLVGHSLGGLLSAMYAGTYPAEIAGIVLVDPTPPNWYQVIELLPEPERAAIVAASEVSEEKVNFAETLEQAKALIPRIPDVPMLLLSANPPPTWPAEARTAWIRTDQAFAGAVPQGEMRRVDTSHYVHQEDPQLIIDEVRRVMAKSR